MMTLEERQIYNRAYHKAYNRIYRKKNRAHLHKYNHQWKQSASGRESLQCAKRKYRASLRGRVTQRRYYENHKQKIKERTKAYVKTPDGRAKCKKYRAKYRASEKGRRMVHNYNVAYLASEHGKLVHRIKTARRLCMKKRLLSDFTIEQWIKTQLAFGNICAYCGKSGRLHQDHFVPITHNGAYSIGNIVPACCSCNSSKRDKLPVEWLVMKKHGLAKLANIQSILEKIEA